MRTALRELADLTDGLDPAWEVPLVDVFRALGRHRDKNHLTLNVEPLVTGAGGPSVEAVIVDVPDPGEAVRVPAFQDTC